MAAQHGLHIAGSMNQEPYSTITTMMDQQRHAVAELTAFADCRIGIHIYFFGDVTWPVVQW